MLDRRVLWSQALRRQLDLLFFFCPWWLCSQAVESGALPVWQCSAHSVQVVYQQRYTYRHYLKLVKYYYYRCSKTCSTERAVGPSVAELCQ